MISYSLEPQGDYISLDGAELPSDTPVYIRVEDTGDIRRVTFFLNDVEIRTEQAAPYSFNGTGLFRKPRPATILPGPHVIRVEILRRDGFVHEEAVSFRVGDPVPEAPPAPTVVSVVTTVTVTMSDGTQLTGTSTEIPVE